MEQQQETKDFGGSRIQLFPHSDAPLNTLTRFQRAFVFKPIELDLLPGTLLRFGRKIDAKKEAGVRWTRDEQIANNASVQGAPASSSPQAPLSLEALTVAPPETNTFAKKPENSSTEPTSGGTVPKQQLISFRSKVVSRSHAELWMGRDGQVYFRDASSSSGTFLNRLRLSPSGKESRPYPLKSGDIIQLGVDYQGRQEEIYKCVTMKIFITDANGVRPRPKSSKMRNALASLISAMNPVAEAEAGDQCPADPLATSCCICLCDMEPYQALFLAPCSHCFHYKCCTPLLASGYMFQCPLCRQVANLEADVSNEDGIKDEDATEGGSENSDEAMPLQPEETPAVRPSTRLPLSRTTAIETVATTIVGAHVEDDDEEDSQPLSRQLTSTVATASPVPIPILASTRTESSNPLNSVLTPPNHHRMSPLASDIHSDDPISNPQDSENREELALVLNEYEQALSRMMGLFPGLGQEEDEQWRERVQRIRDRL